MDAPAPATPPVRPVHAPEYFAPVPTARTRAMRTFIPWQLLRFVVINLKMLRMIGKSHH